jgi:hypothetical protein
MTKFREGPSARCRSPQAALKSKYLSQGEFEGGVQSSQMVRLGGSLAGMVDLHKSCRALDERLTSS